MPEYVRRRSGNEHTKQSAYPFRQPRWLVCWKRLDCCDLSGWRGKLTGIRNTVLQFSYSWCPRSCSLRIGWLAFGTWYSRWIFVALFAATAEIGLRFGHHRTTTGPRTRWTNDDYSDESLSNDFGEHCLWNFRYAIGNAERPILHAKIGWLHSLAEDTHQPYTHNGTLGGPSIKVGQKLCGRLIDWFFYFLSIFQLPNSRGT